MRSRVFVKTLAKRNTLLLKFRYLFKRETILNALACKITK